MPAISLDMLRAAPIRQDRGRPCVLPDRSKFGRNDPMMTHAAPDHVAVSAASLRTLADEVASLSVRVSMLLEAGGVELAPATVLPANVFDLATARARRQAVQR